MKLNGLIESAQTEATSIISELSEKGFTYHNLDHTKGVVNATIEIANTMACNSDEVSILTLAAWFHDTGYSDLENHEARSAEYAAAFLKANGLEDSIIQQVQKLIRSTSIDHRPENLLEQIICDADLHYLGAEDYYSRAARLRQEWELTQDRVLTDDAWHQLNLEFFDSHKFHTSAAHELYAQGKERNKQRIVELLQSC